jgi:hypothetical protein
MTDVFDFPDDDPKTSPLQLKSRLSSTFGGNYSSVFDFAAIFQHSTVFHHYSAELSKRKRTVNNLDVKKQQKSKENSTTSDDELSSDEEFVDSLPKTRRSITRRLNNSRLNKSKDYEYDHLVSILFIIVYCIVFLFFSIRQSKLC